MRIEACVTDLWGDGDGGYSANCCWCRRATIEVDDKASDLAVSRRIKAALGIQGMRTDDWSGSEWSWRDGLVGAYADVVS